MTLWPRTLAAQLVAVTSLAVLLSNFGVAVWFALGNERLNESALTERLLDRAVSVATLMASIPPHAREPAARAMTTFSWHFHIRSGPDRPAPMTPEEGRLATRIRAMLPAATANLPVTVSIEPRLGRRFRHDRHIPANRSIIQLVVPVLRDTQLVMTFFRPPLPPWPQEIFIAAVLAIVASAAAAAFIASRVTRPLSALAAAAGVAARGGPAPRVPEEGPNDVRNAARAFNAMTDQVTRTLESQRQLLSAVGHDLRTPITAMRISAEFVSDAELRERLQKNLSELQDLTEAVLSAARGTAGEPMRQVDLAALVESVCADLDDLDEPVVCAPHPPARYSCRPNEIRRAVRNLAENAVAYGKRAMVSLIDAPDAFEIRVDDEGPGIPEADRARVFEPFVRLESSRNEETGGSGLGLTLVKAIAEGHGGRVVLENRPEGGLRARILLPRDGVSGK